MFTNTVFSRLGWACVAVAISVPSHAYFVISEERGEGALVVGWTDIADNECAGSDPAFIFELKQGQRVETREVKDGSPRWLTFTELNKSEDIDIHLKIRECNVYRGASYLGGIKKTIKASE